MRQVLAVTGTKREAAVLRGSGVDVIAVGGDNEALDRDLTGLRAPLAALISFGMGGALDPKLRIGDWVIGERLCGVTEADCDPAWAAALAHQLPNCHTGPCFADGRMIAQPSEKQSLFCEYGALVADMESHLVAKAAADAGVPFTILRCISDEAAHALPPAIAVAMRPGGGLALGRILRSIARNPRQLPQIFETVSAFNKGYQAMRTGTDSLTGRLGFDLR